MKLLRSGSIGIMIAVIFFYAPLCSAADDEGWELTVAPFIWMAGIEGDVDINGQSADVDISFSDILDNLDLAGMIHMEAKKGRFGFFLDPTYLKVSADQDVGPLGNIDAEFEQESWIIDFGGFYRVGQWEETRPMALDIYLGGRYWNISTKIDVDTPLPGVAVDQDADKDLIDPLVGIRFGAHLSDRFQISLRGDIGGFDISDDTSKLSWQAVGMLGYDVSKSTTIFAGYRAINLDCEKNGDELDLTFQGPVVGLKMLFGGSKAKAAEPPKDSDGDGVYDHLDDCPGTPTGVKVDSNGCPLDSDGDGVYDYMDKCPNTPEAVKVNRSGCPLDSDNDGVYDYMDKCPGTPEGVQVDSSGCPMDSDGDGVYDDLDKCPDTPKGATVNESGCWAFGGEVFFDFNKSEIKSEADPLMKEAVKILEENPEMRIEIQGHTDSRGPEAYNQMLSEKRAMAVKTYLVKEGIDSGRIEVRGYGESDPIASNDTEEGRQKNRRVRFKRIN